MSPLFHDRKRSRSSLAGSVVLHCLLLLGLVALVRSSPRGTTSQPVRRVGLAVAHVMVDREQFAEDQLAEELAATKPAENSGGNSNANEVPQPADADVQANSKRKPSAPISPPIDLDSVLSAMTNSVSPSDGPSGNVRAIPGQLRVGNALSGEQLGSKELVPGVARSGREAGRMTTKIFGVAGTGSTFVYVFDHSESMKAANSKPLRAAKSELLASLGTLTEQQQFQIIFYNDRANVFRAHGSRTGLVQAEEATITRAREFVARIQPSGGTEHETALRLAISMAPDVIFFLTDAEIQTLSESQIDDLTRRAENAGTVVHAIQFGTGPSPGETFLKRLATRNRGGYRYVDVLTLP